MPQTSKDQEGLGFRDMPQISKDHDGLRLISGCAKVTLTVFFTKPYAISRAPPAVDGVVDVIGPLVL